MLNFQNVESWDERNSLNLTMFNCNLVELITFPGFHLINYSSALITFLSSTVIPFFQDPQPCIGITWMKIPTTNHTLMSEPTSLPPMLPVKILHVPFITYVHVVQIS